MKHVVIILAATAILAVTGAAWAERTNDPVKWSQWPDIIPETGPTGPLLINGWDEKSMVLFPIVADDFPCDSLEPVTDLHWWGSYPNLQPGQPPRLHPDGFLIRFWDDVKAGADPDPNVTWSHPGNEVHSIETRTYDVEFFGVDIDPWEYHETGGITRMDDAYQYNYKFERDEWFRQQGTPLDPKVYWISIQAFWDDQDPDDIWGWKTTPHVYNDDGAFGAPGALGGDIDWRELVGPGGLPGSGNVSWDLAFELTIPEPATMSLLALGGLALIRRRRK